MILAILFSAAAFAEDGPEIFSYDYDLKFHLEADAFPLLERERMKGYADLLEIMKFRGNLTFCPKTKSTDMDIVLVPDTDPEAAISFHLKGLPYWWRISSSLMGGEENSVCFRPLGMMAFASRAWDFFNVPLAPLMLLNPECTLSAIQELRDVWEATAGKPEENGKLTVSNKTLKTIADGWMDLFRSEGSLQHWVEALTKPLPQYEMLEYEMQKFPEALRVIADGGKLTISKKDGWSQCKTDSGDVIYKERRDGQNYECILDPPACGAYYLPSLHYRENYGEEENAFHILASWARPAPETYEPEEGEEYAGGEEDDDLLPDTLLGLEIGLDHLPAAFPADASFTGQIDTDGILLPDLHLQMNAEAKADGSIRLEIFRTDREDGKPVFTCTGTVVRIPRTEPLQYQVGDIHNEFNLFALDDQSMNKLVGRVRNPILKGLMNFVYAIPVSSCQSILDTLEEYGFLQVLMQQ